jgi:hypothetical protein
VVLTGREREKRWTLNMETLCSLETFVSSKNIVQYHNSDDHNPEKRNNFLVCFIVKIISRLGYTCPCLFHFGISRERSVGIAMGYGLDGRRLILGRCKRFWSSQRPDRSWGLPSLLSDGYRGAIFPGVQRQEHEAENSLPPGAEVKNSATIPPLPHASSWCDA